MLKKLFFIPFLFLSLSTIAQDQEATLYFRDGTSIEGYGELKMEKRALRSPKKGVILFKTSETDTADEWSGEDVDRIEFPGDNFSKKIYQFVHLPDDKDTRYALLQLIGEGEVKLYASIDPEPGKKRYQTTHDRGVNGPFVSVNEVEYKPDYYVKRANESKLTMFIGNKKRIGEYFMSCPGIMERLKSNEFSVKTLEQIVEYYNDFCAEDSQDSDFED